MAIPIMGTAFIHMAYNLTDMLWIGRVGTNAAAAVGAAGFFLWLANSVVYTTKVGAEVTIAQSLGAKEHNNALRYARHALFLAIIMGIIYGVLLFVFSKDLVGFFNLESSEVNENMQSYLRIVAIGMIFTFINPTYSGMYIGNGLSKTPFYANAIGLILNIILDPLLIYGIGPFPRLEVQGAAYATVISQALVSIIFNIYTQSPKSPFQNIFKGFKPDFRFMKRIFRIGFPVSAQSGIFAVFGMVLARIAAGWGPIGVAVQSVGSQIEAVTWMTASGLSTALASFVGQNYGAKNYSRIRLGYYRTLSLGLPIGLAASVAFILFGQEIFSWFIPEPETMIEGGNYLRILGYSQLFMMLEITTAGAFNGMGKTVTPAITGIVFNGLRIPMALLFTVSLGLSGVWWSITISSWFKGVVLFIWFAVILLRFPIIRSEKNFTQRFLWPNVPSRNRRF